MSTRRGRRRALTELTVGLLTVALVAAACTPAGNTGISASNGSSGPAISAVSTEAQRQPTPASSSPESTVQANTVPANTVPANTVPANTATSSLGPVSATTSVALPGVNDPTCTSDDRPVVLLHGTFSSVRADFAAMVPKLLAAGWCVYGLDYGDGGRGPVRQSAADVSTFIDQVLAETGAAQVDVIGFSQGGLVLRTALRLNELAPKVAVAVLIAPSFHGSTSPLLTALPAGICAACADQAAGSALLTELAAGGDLDGAVRYAVVSSADDTVVTPVAAQVPQGPADRVTSILVQDGCPAEMVDHVSLRANPGVVAWVVDALRTDGSPVPTTLTCA